MLSGRSTSWLFGVIDPVPIRVTCPRAHERSVGRNTDAAGAKESTYHLGFCFVGDRSSPAHSDSIPTRCGYSPRAKSPNRSWSIACTSASA